MQFPQGVRSSLGINVNNEGQDFKLLSAVMKII